MQDPAPQQPLLFVSAASRSHQANAIRKHVHGKYREWNRLNTRSKDGILQSIVPKSRPRRRYTKKVKIKSSSASVEQKHATPEADDQIVKTDSGRLDEGMRFATALLNRLPKPFYGNSDPFNSAVIKITPYICELIQSAERSQTFLASPPLWTLDLRQRVLDRHKAHLQVAIGDEINMLVVLATGACFKGDGVRALEYMTRAIGLIRDEVSFKLYFVVRNLTALEFTLGNLTAARIHHRASVKIARQEFERDYFVPLPVSDVWIARLSLQPTEMKIDDWDPGPRALGRIRRYDLPDELAKFLSGLHELAALISQPLAGLWAISRAAALSGRCQNQLLNHFDSESTCIYLAASVAMHVMFPIHAYTPRDRVWQRSYRRLVEAYDCDHSLRLWLYYMGAVNERLLKSGTWALQQFDALRREMDLSSFETKEVLRHYVYVDEMEAVLHSEDQHCFSCGSA